MACKNCGNTKIKTRRNYSHGKKSKPHITKACAGCGSIYLNTHESGKRKRRRR